MNIPATFTLLALSGLSAGCLAGSAAESEDLLLSKEVPTHVSRSSTGDFFVDAKTDLGWSTRVSVALDYSEAPMYCASLGFGWRLPTLGELKTMTEGAGKQRSMRADFKAGLPKEGLLLSAEEIPVIDDDKQPLAMRIATGETVNAHGREGYVRCAHGPETRKRKPFPGPPAQLLGEVWWEKSNACPSGAIARGTLGLEVACKSKLGQRNGRMTRWTKGERFDASYRNDKLHGTVTRWRSESGTASIQNYRNGEFHGRNTQWYPNGQKSTESDFVSGVLHGVEQRWNEKSQLLLRTQYRRGRIVDQLYYDHDKPRHGSIAQTYANGVTSYVGVFKKGRAVGQHYGYHQNGKLRFKRMYSAKGIPDGASADWHANGQPHELSTFKNGALQGERAVYSSDGKLLSRVYYDQGLVATK